MKVKFLFLIFFLGVFHLANSQNIWDSIADFGGGQRQRAVSFSLNNKGYVGTGLDTADIVHNDLWEYDPKLDSWSQVADLPGVGRRNAASFTIGNRAYVGTGVDNVVAPNGTILKDFYEYNADLNEWLQIEDYPGSGSGVYFASGFNAGGKGYICGGKLGSDNYTSKLFEYKPSTNTWSERSSFPGGVRYQMVGFSIDGFAYLGLGADEDIYRKDWYKYNPGSNQWTKLEDFYGGERASSVTFILNGNGYIAMGTDGGYEDDIWEYDEEYDSWTLRENFPGKGRKFASSFTIGDTAYVGIGKAYDGGKRSFNKYYPSYLGAKNNNINVDFNVFPNPINNYFTIKNTKLPYSYVELRSIDLKLIQKFEKSSNSRYEIKESLFNSIYFIILKDNFDKTLSIRKVYAQ